MDSKPDTSGDGFWPAMREFKKSLCDENKLIADALRSQCQRWLQAPILDVGAGLGDIAASAFPEKSAVLLDLNQIEIRSSHHMAVRGDFFDYVADQSRRPRTVLFCHVLQYIDDDWGRLRSKISGLDPENVIAVTNDNDEEFGALVSWALSHVPGINPEQSVVQLDSKQYKLAQTIPIKATIRCPDFATLANHLVVGLLDAAPTPATVGAIVVQLEKLLRVPTLTINETIYCYEKI